MPNQSHTPSIDELIELPEPGDPQISPAGDWVAYTVYRADWKQNEFIHQIWVAPVSGGEPRQITFARQSSYAPRWSPDGNWLAFLSQREGDQHTQIYRISVMGGEAERLTEYETDISSFRWAPDGKAIAFLAADAESEEYRQRVETFGEYRVEDEDLTRAHLWLLRLSDRSVVKVTHGDAFHIVEFEWHPTGEWLAFESWPTPGEGDYDRGRIYTLQMATFGVTAISDEGCTSPLWSVDGSRLAYVKRGVPTYYANNSIHIVDFRGLANPSEVNLAAQPQEIPHASRIFEEAAFAGPSPRHYQVPVTFDEILMLSDWGLDGLYGFAIQRTSIHLFRINAESGQVTRVTPEKPEGWKCLSATFDRDYSHAALVASSARRRSEVVVLDLASGKVQYLTNFQGEIDSWKLGKNEVFRWTSTDGTPVEGVLTKPADFDPHQKYPLLVVIHGGPCWGSFQSLLNFEERGYFPIQQWVARGALVLQPNYRGSAGYGEAFRSLNVRNLGLGDYADIISGVDALIQRGWVDAERVGAMGWSQGGYIAALIATYSDRFAAVSVGAGISNWVTYYTNTDIHPFTRQYLGSTPWEDMDVYRKTSPMTYIRQARTPTLILHGELDKRVPVPNAYELYQGLKDMGVETKLVVYRGVGHMVFRPRLNRQVMQENLNWFNRWLWGEVPEMKPSITCYVALAGFVTGDSTDTEARQNNAKYYLDEVRRLAQRDDVDFCVFSGEEGLSRPVNASPVPLSKDVTGVTAKAVFDLAGQIADQLRADGVSRIVVFVPEDLKQEPPILIAVGSLQIACGLAGHVRFEMRQVRV